LTGKGEEARSIVAAPQLIATGVPLVKLIFGLPSINTLDGVLITGDEISFDKAGLYFISVMAQSLKDVDGFVVGLYIIKYPEPPTDKDNYSLAEAITQFNPTGATVDFQQQYLSAVVYMDPGQVISVGTINNGGNNYTITTDSYLHIVRIA
jgi:hypothetical protein